MRYVNFVRKEGKNENEKFVLSMCCVVVLPVLIVSVIIKLIICSFKYSS